MYKMYNYTSRVVVNIRRLFFYHFEKSTPVLRNIRKHLIIYSVSEKPNSVNEIKKSDKCPESPSLNKMPHEPPGITNLERKHRISSATSELNQGDRVIRNQSDIFSLNEETSIASSIFSVNGSPSRKLYRKKELPPNNVFPMPDILMKEQPPADQISPRDKIKNHSRNSYSDLKRPSSSLRNPLTGTGLSSNDEYKCKTTKRKGKNFTIINKTYVIM